MGVERWFHHDAGSGRVRLQREVGDGDDKRARVVSGSGRKGEATVATTRTWAGPRRKEGRKEARRVSRK